MFLHKIESPGLAHFSYVVGSGREAAVIDPRRDIGVYLERARQEGARIVRVFETHRNEDLLSGAALLAGAAGCSVHHGPDSDGEVAYAETVEDGACFRLGELTLRVLHTPGHTLDSICLALFEGDPKGPALAVFTGDTLFTGDVGRADFYPRRAREVAGLMHDSLFSRILPLGDQAIVLPAHGPGSICGNAMADRPVSTVGYERVRNPMLRLTDRERFIEAKLAEHHYLPPYFRRMEAGNLEGAGPVEPAAPAAGDPRRFAAAMERGMTAVDLREPEAFLGAHVPGALSLPLEMVSSFAGWMLDPEATIGLVADGPAQAAEGALRLARIGYDRVEMFLAGGLHPWSVDGRMLAAIDLVRTEEVRKRLERRDGWTLLDVRSFDEYRSGHIEGAVHVYVGELPRNLDMIPSEDRICLICGSGRRATVAASVLRRAGLLDLEVYLGSMGAWRRHDNPLVRAA